MFLKFILLLFISAIAFDFLLMYLDKKGSRIISSFKNISKKWKGKWLIKWIVRLNLILILAFLQIVLGADEILITVLLGFSLSLTDFAFSKDK